MSCRDRMCVLAWILVVGPALAAQAAESTQGAAPGLRPAAFDPLPLGSIKPAGWLADQLRIQAGGLSGHLDEFWPDIKDSGWFGGKAEGWERVPYWLDGVVPLAYLLDDARLQAKVKRALDSILNHQHPDGWLGPVGDSQKHKPYDVWPLFPLFKAMTQYQEATGDPRVVPALLKCCRKIGEVLAREPLYSWARFRAADLAVSVYWLYDRTKEPWLLDLARTAFAQSHDWRAQFDDFRFTTRTQGKFALDTHGVNTGMALKYGGVRYRLTGDVKDRDAVFRMLDLLDRYHGQATGIFTCDEHLAGRSPSQGTELCTVVEAMYSLEVLASVRGDARLGDRLEQLAFNALPATFKKDMTAHQYDQQCNQVICSARGEHVYVNNGPASNLYGLEPNFGCCTANMHQGWPKFVAHLWMKTPDGGLAVIAYAPCAIETTIQGKPVKLAVETTYPFRDEIAITVSVSEPMSFPLVLRVPGWAETCEIRAEGVAINLGGRDVDAENIELAVPRSDPQRGGMALPLKARWNGTKTVALRFPMPVRLYRGDRDAVAIARGPLVFALPIQAEWKKVKDNPQFADWEVYPRSPWNYALQLDREHPERAIAFEDRLIGHTPFSPQGAPVIATVKGRRLAGWGLEKGAAAPPPPSPAATGEPPETLTLIPYGCTDLRITEFPVSTQDAAGRTQ
ncbi:MAG TPA: beta-L-arabinofuranosidase domain-containing protein [Isosphaeraceae bacterium]|nr:beta-L-arabinofuranosidase domain-containing protein [Isosphaeraceae bacterium]